MIQNAVEWAGQDMATLFASSSRLCPLRIPGTAARTRNNIMGYDNHRSEARPGLRHPPQNRWIACGANSPIASMPIPAIPRAPPAKASAAMPVITWAEANTMPIWNAAEPSS